MGTKTIQQREKQAKRLANAQEQFAKGEQVRTAEVNAILQAEGIDLRRYWIPNEDMFYDVTSGDILENHINKEYHYHLNQKRLVGLYLCQKLELEGWDILAKMDQRIL